MNIFFDLDGTLIDSRKRLYRLFQHLVSESTISYGEYWHYKRNRISAKEILINRFNYSENEFKVFREEWMCKIELPEWLALDTPFVGVFEYLNELKISHRLYIVTARQSEFNALAQIDQYGWRPIFEKVLVTGQKLEKYDLIVKTANVEKHDWFIGDTGDDIQTGKRLGIHTAAVLSGFMNKQCLLEYQPDLIVDDVLKLKIT